jgi:putative transposase
MDKHALLKIDVGQTVLYQEKRHLINKVIDVSKVELIDDQTQSKVIADIAELAATSENFKNTPQDLLHIDDENWEIANQRFSVIKPLLALKNRTRQDVANVADANNVHTNTVYGWLKIYESFGVVSSLLPRVRNDKGVTKLDERVEEVIKEFIASDYLTKQKKRPKKVIDLVKARCLKEKLPVPHDNTIRSRIRSLAPALTAAKREGKHAANTFQPVQGKFPGADWPLAVVQIDNTKLDIILVDDHYRKPIGRPWITLAFDVYSRMVTGFYVSFDPPGNLSTGMCLVHSILPKDNWLLKHDVNGEWPLWGLPQKIHMDNAKEFRSQMLQRACKEYGIDIEWRPVARPNFGAHVERALGTLSKEIHALPGSTFSSVAEKGDYDSEKHSALTLTEFESWLAHLIVDVYHQRLHTMIGMSPLEKYRKGILGDGDNPGVGLPPKINNEEKLTLDLMPFEMRVVGNEGIVIDKIYYYHDVLRPWINSPEPGEARKKRKFMCRRDPRDISQIWFYDPELQTYFAIPYRDTSHPAISIWELREANKRLTEAGRSNINEAAIFEAYDRMRDIEQEAVAKTKSARRTKQRREHHQQVSQPANTDNSKVIQQPTPIANEPEVETSFIKDIKPFDEMDEW